MAQNARSYKVQLIGLVVATVIIALAFTFRKEILDIYRQREARQAHNDSTKKDLQTVESSQAKAREKSAALLRLALKNNEHSFKLAEKWLQEDDPKMKQMALSALAFAPPERALKQIHPYVADSNVSLRMAAYRAMERMRQPESIPLLAKKAEGKELKFVEWITVQGTLYAIQPSAYEKEEQLEKVLAQLDRRKSSELAQGLMVLVSKAPKSKILKTYAEKRVKSEKDPEVLRSLILFLGRFKNKTVAQNLKTYLSHEKVTLRGAALQSLTQICPSNRWSLLKEFYQQEKNANLLAATVSLPKRLGGIEAIEFLKEMTTDHRLKPKDQKRAKADLEALQKKPAKPCAQMVVR